VRRLLIIVAVAAALPLALPGGGGAAGVGPILLAMVGENDSAVITLNHPSGARVTQLVPGPYRIVVRDLSDVHNFHLRGPGVARATGVEGKGEETWDVVFVEGRYTYLCDPHSTSMRGTFTVGNPPPPAPPVRRLVATVGPKATITLRTPAGRVVRTTPAGPYRITVRDRSALHNFRLTGPRLNRATGVSYRGTRTWTVQLRKGATYRFRCDPHRLRMRGSFRVT
jgi:plastocyanin